MAMLCAASLPWFPQSTTFWDRVRGFFVACVTPRHGQILEHARDRLLPHRTGPETFSSGEEERPPKVGHMLEIPSDAFQTEMFIPWTASTVRSRRQPLQERMLLTKLIPREYDRRCLTAISVISGLCALSARWSVPTACALGSTVEDPMGKVAFLAWFKGRPGGFCSTLCCSEVWLEKRDVVSPGTWNGFESSPR
jgi:hypothetical protein